MGKNQLLREKKSTETQEQYDDYVIFALAG